MVNYGESNPEEAPKKPQLHRFERKYGRHKRAQVLNHQFYQRGHGGESAKDR